MPTYAFTIGGALKSLQVGWSISESANGRNRFTGVVLSRDGSYRPAVNDEVIFTEDGTRIFGGVIDVPSETGHPKAWSKAHLVHTIEAADFSVYANRIHLTADIPAGTTKAALQVVADALTDQGVTLDVAQVNGPALPALSYVDAPIIDVLNEIVALANGTGSTSWIWELDYNKVLRAYETGTVSAPFNIADNDGKILGDVSVTQPRASTYANYVIVRGGSGTRDVTDTFTGDGVTVTFALRYTLASTYGYVTVAGIFETLDTVGGATWLYDSATNTITRTVAPGVAVAISITYVAQFPKVVFSDGGVTAADRVMKTYDVPDVYDVDVLQALADSYVTRDMSSPKTVGYAAAYSLTGIHPGQAQTIVRTKHGLSGAHLITDVRIANQRGRKVQRTVTAVSGTRLPGTFRENFQQLFQRGGGGSGGAGSVTVVTGGTYLSSPASLGGSDTVYRIADGWTRVPNALIYVAPATMSVLIRGSVAAHQAVNVSLRLWDVTAGAAAFTGSAVAANVAPTDYTAAGSVTAGHTYFLQMLSGTAGVPVTGIAHMEST